MEIPLLRELGFIVCAAAGMALALRGMRVPAIVAYMLAGLLLGPVLGLVEVSESVDQIAEAGIALLLFLVGLELSLATVRGLGPVVLVTAGIQVTASLGAGLAAALLLGFNAVESTIIGGAVAISSTVVAVKLLEERRALGRMHGRIAVGVLLVQDVVVIIALTLLAGLGGGGESGAASFAGQIARAFGGMAVLSALALLGARWLLARPLLRMAGAPEATLVWGLAWCFLFILAAESLHLSVELGAFIAGLGLAQLPAAEELRRRVQPLVDFFVAVFFVTLGIGIDLGSLSDVLVPALVLSALVLLLKPVSVFFPVRASGYGERVAFNAALTLGQVSEFSFILATAALAQGLIDQGVLALVALVGLFTIAISSFAIVRADGLYGRFRAWGLLRGREATADDEEEAPRRDHVIVVGMNSLGRRIATALTARGERVLAVDTDPGKLAHLPCETLVGSADSSRVLEEADLPSARLLVSALQIEDSNNLVTYWATRYGVPASVHAFDPSLVEELEKLGAAHLMVSKHDGIRQVATALREQGVID